LCGDGLVAGSEKCDDGNKLSGDGCNGNCGVELGYHCANTACTESICLWQTGNEVCGDGFTLGAEIDTPDFCDDGGTSSGDGCSATCTVECGFHCADGLAGAADTCATRCGDGVRTSNEDCDDGNTIIGDGCSSCIIDNGFVCSESGPCISSMCVCKAGFSTNIDTDISACIICQDGYYKTLLGPSECLLCPVGSESDADSLGTRCVCRTADGYSTIPNTDGGSQLGCVQIEVSVTQEFTVAMSEQEFDSTVQLAFKKALALEYGTSADRITLTVSTISATQSLRRRRLLAETISVIAQIEMHAASQTTPSANFIQNIRASLSGAQVVVVGTSSGPLPSPTPSPPSSSPLASTSTPTPPAQNIWTALWALIMYGGIALFFLMWCCILVCVRIAQPTTNYDVGVPQHQIVQESLGAMDIYAHPQMQGPEHNPTIQHWEWQHPQN